MARQTTWVVALLVTCVAAGSVGAAAQQVRPTPSATQNAAKDPRDSSKDSRDKAPAVPGRADDRERWKWWLYDRAELVITDQQSRDINAIFESTVPRLRESRQELDRAEEEMSRIIKEHKADLAVVSAQLDRVESARSQHNKTRTLMLYRMHLLLTADQRTKLEALRARQQAARKEPPPPPGHRRYP